PAVAPADLALPPPAEGSAQVAARVTAARARQTARYAAIDGKAGGRVIRTNADVDGELLEQLAAPDAEGRKLLTDAAEKFKLTARGYHASCPWPAPSPTSTPPRPSAARTSRRPSATGGSPCAPDVGSRGQRRPILSPFVQPLQQLAGIPCRRPFTMPRHVAATSRNRPSALTRSLPCWRHP